METLEAETDEAPAAPATAAPAQAASAADAPEAVPHGRRNFALGIANGTLGSLAQDFLHPEILLGGLIMTVTGSPLLVACLTVANKLGGLMPQVALGSFSEHLPRKRPVYVALMVLRVFVSAAMVGGVWLVARQATPATLLVFFGAFFLLSMLGGSGFVVMLSMVGDAIDRRRLGAFLGSRHVLGGVLAVVAGLYVIQPIENRIGLPWNYTILAAVGCALALAGMMAWALCHETDGAKAGRRTTLRESLARGFRWLRKDRNYRRYLGLRIAFRITFLSLTFFIPYGVERLQYPAHPRGIVVLVGVMVAANKLSRTVAGPLWGSLADRRGYRACLIGGGAGFVAAPVLAIVAPWLPRAFTFQIPWTTVVLDLPLCTYFLGLATFGAAIQASIVGGHRFALVSAPDHRRISYMGFLNTITSPLTLLPLAAGFVAEAYNVRVLFPFIALGGVLYLALALGMDSERDAPAVRANGRA